MTRAIMVAICTYIALVLAVFFFLDEPATPQLPHPSQFTYTFQTAIDFPVLTSPTEVVIPINPPNNMNSFKGNRYICSIEVRGTGQQVTLSDGQGGSFLWPGGATSTIGVSGTSTTSLFVAPNDSLCRFMPGGIFLSANATGVTATLVVKHNSN